MQDTCTAPTNTRVMTFKELIRHDVITSIVNSVLNQPNHDSIIMVGRDEGIKRAFTNPGNIRQGDWCVAGSAAVAIMASVIRKHAPAKLTSSGLVFMVSEKSRSAQPKPIEWTPGDTDIFMLNAKKPDRMTVAGGTIDMVHATETSIPELLLNFDLPCCRAAYDGQYNWYISVQCLTAMVTGQYRIPHYLTDRSSFLGIFVKARANLTPTAKGRSFAEYMFNRLTDRIQKYSQRGFTAITYQTDVILPWVKTRFSYATSGHTKGHAGLPDVTEQTRKALSEFHLAPQPVVVQSIPSESIPAQSVSPPSLTSQPPINHVTLVSKSDQRLTVPFPQGDLVLLGELSRIGFSIESIQDTAPVNAYSQGVEVPIRNGDIKNIKNLCALGFIVTDFTDTGVIVKRAN